MPSTNKRHKGGLSALALSGTLSPTVPGVGGTITTTGTATSWPDGSGTRSFVIKIDSEEILVSARAGNVLTVEGRGHSDTIAATHTDGAAVKHVLDAASVQQFEDHLVDTVDAHDASAISYAGGTGMFATDLEAAVDELATEKVDKGGSTWSGPMVGGDQLLSRVNLKDFGEEIVIHGNTGSTETIDIEGGNVHTITLDANCTLTFSNPTATGKACSFTLWITQDGTGSRTITWPATVKWDGGTAPTLSTVAGSLDIITFSTPNGGTSWVGVPIGFGFA